MKKYFVGLLAVSFAIVCFAFTSKKFATGPACTEQHYWFQVKNGINKDCSALILSDFELIEDVDGNGLPNEAPFGTPSITPFGCPDQNVFACALSFAYNSTPSLSQIERVEIPVGSGVFYFRPKSTVIDNDLFKCCVKRPQTNP
jgi:hypothetical protein